MRVDPRQRQLDGITLGEIAPAEAFPLLRDLLTEDAPKFARRVYLALQDVVLRIVADRVPEAEAAQWLDVCGRASVLMRQGGADVVDHQVAALGDMVERTGRFFEAQPVAEVLGRRHVPEVLGLLAANAGQTNRAAVLEATGLGQSNLSRMLSTLERHGLVRRSRSGREAELSLTPAGRAAAARLAGEGAPVRPEAVWQARGVGICVTTPDRKVLSVNPGFEDAVGTPAEIAVASVSDGSGIEDVGTAEERWVRRVEAGEAGGGTMSVWVDVSDLRLALADAEKRASTAEASVAGLRAALASAQAEAAAAERRLRLQQLSVEVVRERAVGRLGSMATLVHERLSGRGGAGRSAEDGPHLQIAAIKDALDSFLEATVPMHRTYGAAVQNGKAIVGHIVKAAGALTAAKIDVDLPEWLGTQKANYRALAEPLGHVLLNADGGVTMRITRDAGMVVVTGIGRRTADRMHSARAADFLDVLGGQGLADTWKDSGVELRVGTVASAGDGVDFRLSMPLGTDDEGAERRHGRTVA